MAETKEPCGCAGCRLNAAIRTALTEFMFAREKEGDSFTDAGARMVGILSFHMSRQSNLVVSTAFDKNAAMAAMAREMSQGHANGMASVALTPSAAAAAGATTH